MYARWSPPDEIIALRTPDSRTFDNHDGTRSVVIAGPVHRQVAPGVWQELEPGAGTLDDSVVEIGSETRNDCCVWYAGANYFRCQHLYLARELNFSGYVTKLAFFSDTTGTNVLKSSTHSLRDIPDTILPAGDTWIPEGNQVWQGDLVCGDLGWNELVLQTPAAHAADSSLLVSYWHWNDSVESPAKFYRESYCGILPRAHWGYSASNPRPPMFPRAWRANVRITYVPLAEANDVQALSIVSPIDTILKGQPCIPKAVVRNNGVIPATFPVGFSISDGYVATDTVTGLSPGTEDTVVFAAWPPDSAGSFAVKCWTCLAGDQHPENDTQTDLVFVVSHDVGVSRIIAPIGIVPMGDSVQPSVLVHNWGNTDESPEILVEISRTGNTVYAESIQRIVAGGESTAVSLSRYWLADSAGDHEVKAWTSLPGDMNPANDSTRANFSVRFLPLHDAGATQILAPRDTTVQDSALQPRAEVHNFGCSGELVPVSFCITGRDTLVYADTVEVQLVPGESTTVGEFRSWTAAQDGSYQATCRTLLAADMDSTNDAISDSFQVVRRLRHDIGVLAIIAPAGAIDSGNTVTPVVRIANLGDYQQSGVVRFAISDSPPYLRDVLVSNLAAGAERDVEFPAWIACRVGSYAARCSLSFSPDDRRANDTLSNAFEVVLPTPWYQMADLPEGLRHKNVRSGAALASDGVNLVYALKGNRTREFYAYDVAGDSWIPCCSIPSRRITRGAALCYAPVDNRLYALHANSKEFWSYRPADNTWQRRADVPAGLSGKRPGVGSALAMMDTGYVYLLKCGGTREFFAYEPGHDTWLALAPAPGGVSGRGYRVGSCLVAVRDYLYLLKGGENEFFAYSTTEDTWYGRAPLPTIGTGGSRKPARAGTAVTHDHDAIYVIKGNRSAELWWYDTFGDSWVERRALPTGPSRRPATEGGALAFAANRLWALKGNNTREFWAYQSAERSSPAADRRNGVLNDSEFAISRSALTVSPNPFNGSTSITYSLSEPGVVSLGLYDIAGRLVRRLCSGFQLAGIRMVTLDSNVPDGVYVLRLVVNGKSLTRKLIRA
jgi:hypothetical protein